MKSLTCSEISLPLDLADASRCCQESECSVSEFCPFKETEKGKKKKKVMFHDGNILLTEKNIQDDFFNM